MDRASVFSKYKTVAGQSFSVGSFGRGDFRLRVANTNETECDEFVRALVNDGFVLTDDRVIPAKYPEQKNRFFLLSNDKGAVFVFYNGVTKDCFITLENEKTIVFKGNEYVEKLVNVTVGQVDFVKGMGYIVQFENGEFLLIDGGEKGYSTAQKTYEYLLERVPAGGKPTIALWIFTHAHHDHIGMATEFFKEYSSKVTVRAFAYQFPEPACLQVSMENGAKIKEFSDCFERLLKEKYPLATIYTPHTGQAFNFAGAKMEILYSPDDTYPSYYTNFNELSLAFSLQFDNGKKLLFLGDCMGDGCRRMATTYGEYLKSDYLQLAHHGLIGGDRTLYELVNPKVCLWATDEERFTGEGESGFRWCLGEGGCDYNAWIRDEKVAVRKHYCYGKKLVLEL